MITEPLNLSERYNYGATGTFPEKSEAQRAKALEKMDRETLILAVEKKAASIGRKVMEELERPSDLSVKLDQFSIKATYDELKDSYDQLKDSKATSARAINDERYQQS